MAERREYPLPCARHGRPDTLHPENALALKIYEDLRGAHVYQTYQVSEDRNETKAFLNVQAAKILCDAYETEFLTTFERLKLIHKEIYG